MTQALFWICVGFVAYAYVGYLLVLQVLVKVRSQAVRRGDYTPRMSLIIAARNEDARIANKLQQALALDYPRERLEIIVASDCSTDDTHAIVRSFDDERVRLVVSPERRGKEFAQKTAIESATGDILVFSDAATGMDNDGLRQIARNFADPTVGCVSSVDRMVGKDGEISGEGLYVRYEMRLRALESETGSVIGLSGSLFAARREVCQPWPVDLPSDFITVLNTLRHGMRGISDPAVVGYYADLSDPTREYNRKVRTVTRGIRALAKNLRLLNPFVYGLVAWQLFSHKLCRWVVPFALVGALVSSIALALTSQVYAAAVVGQAIFYAIALYGFKEPERMTGLPRAITFFALANASIVHGWVNVATGRSFATWEPSKRPTTV
jgi:glycosyltransferase involved in cell wall biosynthesis